LYSYHIQDWVAECKKLNLTIQAKDALDAIAKLHGIQLESQVQQRPHFTPQHFVDALAKFIVATDQVYFNSFHV
jgi:hypothetical protein